MFSRTFDAPILRDPILRPSITGTRLNAFDAEVGAVVTGGGGRYVRAFLLDDVGERREVMIEWATASDAFKTQARQFARALLVEACAKAGLPSGTDTATPD